MLCNNDSEENLLEFFIFSNIFNSIAFIKYLSCYTFFLIKHNECKRQWMNQVKCWKFKDRKKKKIFFKTINRLQVSKQWSLALWKSRQKTYCKSSSIVFDVGWLFYFHFYCLFIVNLISYTYLYFYFIYLFFWGWGYRWGHIFTEDLWEDS